MREIPYHFGFLMAQVAGHVSNYQNLRRIVEGDASIEADWCEVSSYRHGGRIERVTHKIGRGQSLRPLLEVRRFLRDHPTGGYDALLSNTGTAAFYASALGQRPTICDFDVTPMQMSRMPEYGSGGAGRRAETFGRRMKQRLWERAAKLQAWSEWAKSSAVDDYGVDPDHVVVNPPGVDLSFWSPPEQGRRGRSSVRVLFVGGDFHRKGGDLLLDWFTKSRHPHVEIDLVTRENVVAPSGVRVHADVEPNTQTLLDLFWNADLFVMPSRAECFGIATVEAMATGLPVITTDVGASNEIVDHDGNGLIIEPSSAGELGDAIEQMVSDEDLRHRFGLRARQIVESRFDLEVNATTTLDLMKQLADQNPLVTG